MRFEKNDKVVHIDLITHPGLFNVSFDIKEICMEADKNVMREGVVNDTWIFVSERTGLAEQFVKVIFDNNSSIIASSSYFIPYEVTN